MAYNLLGQQGPKGDRNPDPNLTDEQATYLYDKPPGQGENKGLTGAGKPVDEADVQQKLANVSQPPTTQPPTTGVKTGNPIKDLQTILKNAGFDPGPIDGIVGPKTRAGVESYINSLPENIRMSVYEYYNNLLGNIKKPKKTPWWKSLGYDTEAEAIKDGVTSVPTTAPKTSTWFEILGYDTEAEAVKDGLSPSSVVKDWWKKLGYDTEDEAIKDGVTGLPKDFIKNITSGPQPIENWWSSLGYNSEDVAIKDGANPLDLLNSNISTPTSNKSFAELVNEAFAGAESMPSDATNYDVDQLNKELGITNTALGSSIRRGWERAMRGDLGANEYIQLVEDVNKAIAEYQNPDNSLAQRAGAFLRKGAMGLGFLGRGVGSVLEETFGGLFNAGTDIFRAEPGGVGDAFFDALVGADQGTNTLSNWFNTVKPGFRYDSATNKFYDIRTGNVVTAEEALSQPPTTQPPGGAPGGGAGGAGEGPLYWGRYDSGSWATSTKPGKPEGFKWAWELDEFPDKNEDLYTSDKSIDEILDLVGEPEVININNQMITLYKRGESPITVPATDAGQYLSRGWSTTQPVEGGVVDIAVEDTEEEVGPGQVVSDKLNEFNNVPQNSILIEAGGQLFLGYEVPGAYGQMYNGNPIFMLYEVLGNDVFEAGILTEGASPQINVSLGSLEDLNQYGIIVGGTDELTDDVEHPFIRFTENFEAGKRVNPWLNDTEINPNTGITYQQEAIEFLAEQALEQWTPETTQVRYEGSDWYRKSTTAQKTWLTTLLTQPQQANQDIQDKQIEVKIAMEANGIASPPDALVNWVAEKAVTGMWTQVYTDQQIALLADPYKPGTRDTGMVNFIEGVGVGTLDRLTVGEKTVRDLYRRYLGPSLGNASDTEIAEKAGQLRSNPDAEEQLKAYLEQQRLAMFGNYTNPTLTYNDIVQPYKNLVNQVWGQEVDETQDWFIKMVQDNDIEKAYTTLREKGIDQGIERVQDQALNDLQRSIGQGQIAPQLGANT